MTDDEKLITFWKALCILAQGEPCKVSWELECRDNVARSIFRIRFSQYIGSPPKIFCLERAVLDRDVLEMSIDPVYIARLEFNTVLAKWHDEVQRRVEAML
jgi:hypothetical protein